MGSQYFVRWSILTTEVLIHVCLRMILYVYVYVYVCIYVYVYQYKYTYICDYLIIRSPICDRCVKLIKSLIDLDTNNYVLSVPLYFSVFVPQILSYRLSHNHLTLCIFFSESSLTSLCNTFQGIGNASIGFLSSPSTSSSGSCSVTLTPSDGQVVSLDLIYLDLSTSQSHENSSLLLLGNHSFSLQYSFTTFPDQTLTMLTFTNLTVSYIPDGTVFILQYNGKWCFLLL